MKFKTVCLIGVICMALSTASVNAGVTAPLGDSGWTLFVSNTMQQVDFNYNYVTGGTVIDFTKTFTRPMDELGCFTPIIVEFIKTSPNASSQITINSEYIRNLTGSEWGGFQMQLMVGMMNPQAGFNEVEVDGSLLEDVTYMNNVGYAGKPILLNFANETGDGVLSCIFEEPFQPGFMVGSIQININPNAPLYTRIGLKEIPIAAAPEPATVMMLGLGALTMLKKRKQNLC